MKVRVNRSQGLFVLPAGDGGFSCLGFDVCEERTKKLAAELGVNPLSHRKGTRHAYMAYEQLVEVARQKNAETGWRSDTELIPELKGLEGRRIEVVDRWGQRRRFYVGRSTGFIPIHLEIARRDSTGGPGSVGSPFRSIRVLEQTRW